MRPELSWRSIFFATGSQKIGVGFEFAPAVGENEVIRSPKNSVQILRNESLCRTCFFSSLFSVGLYCPSDLSGTHDKKSRELGQKYGVEYAEASHYLPAGSVGAGIDPTVDDYVKQHAVTMK